jgi:hypothetical protein
MSGFHNSPEGERFAIYAHMKMGVLGAGYHLLCAIGLVGWHCWLAYKDHKRNLERLQSEPK